MAGWDPRRSQNNSFCIVYKNRVTKNLYFRKYKKRVILIKENLFQYLGHGVQHHLGGCPGRGDVVS